MGFFNKLLSKEKFEIGAPLRGTVIPVTEVSDPTFGQELLGKGVAIRPTDGRVCAPCDGVVSAVFNTGHAVSVTSAKWGAEILIHVGLDTVKLEGKHYTIHAQKGDTVKTGDLLIECDIEGIRADGYDTITPIVICNSEDFHDFSYYTGKDVEIGDTVIIFEK